MEVSVRVEIPDGWELADERMRPPREGEHFLDRRSVVHVACFDFCDSHIILRPAWKWPEWLTAGWIILSPAGRWLACDSEPYIREARWISAGLMCVLDPDLVDFTPPPCNDWRESKRRNPNLDQTDD